MHPIGCNKIGLNDEIGIKYHQVQGPRPYLVQMEITCISDNYNDFITFICQSF